MKILTYDPHKSKLIKAGDFIPETKIFIKQVSAKHFMNIIQGYGIQENVIEQLKEYGCQTVLIKTPTGNLTSLFSDWIQPKIKVMDYGNGKQRFMPIKYMSRKGTPNQI